MFLGHPRCIVEAAVVALLDNILSFDAVVAIGVDRIAFVD